MGVCSISELSGHHDGRTGHDRPAISLPREIGPVYYLPVTPHKAVVQVKSGKVSSRDVRDLKGTVEREQAALSLFITLEEPTWDMRAEADSAGFYHSDTWQRGYPKLQLRTVAELLAGTEFEVPKHPSMYQAAQRVQRAQGHQAAFDHPTATPAATPQPSPHMAVAPATCATRLLSRQHMRSILTGISRP